MVTNEPTDAAPSYEDRIRARIATLQTERAQFVDHANRMIATYGGAIAELEALLAPPETPTEEAAP